MRLLQMVTFSCVVKQSLSACLGGVMVTCTDPDWRSVFVFFFAFESAHEHCLVRSVPVVHFCLEVCLGAGSRTSEHAESLCDDVLPSAYWRPIWRDTESHRQRELQLHRASHLWAAALACAREQRVSVGPRQYRRPHSAISLSKTPPRILCLWQKWHRLDQALIFTGLQWFLGLLGPFASLALPAGGCLLAFDHPSMSLFFLCVRTRTRAMMFSPWWKKKYWQTVTSQ